MTRLIGGRLPRVGGVSLSTSPGTPDRAVSLALTHSFKWAAAVIATGAVLLLPTAAGARTDARTHRFAPAPDVTVSFVLARHRVSGTIIRFASNRVSLTRTRGRVLTLHVGSRHTRRIRAPRHRARRVVLTLCGTRGRAKLRVGRQAATLGDTFVAERAVAVRRRSVVSLRIATRRGRVPAATTLPAAPTPAPPPAKPRLFAPDSVWNAPLPANAPLDPANATLVNTLRKTVAQNMAAWWGPWIATGETSPLYMVPADQPTVRVTLDAGSWNVALQQALNAVPIPANATPALGPDAHMTVWQPSTDHLWELFKARKLADGWHASYGGAMSNASASPGYFDTSSWPGLSQPVWGATASSLPAIAGTVMIEELKAGVIPHALAMNIPWAKPKTYSWPAQRTDGRSTDPNAIPEGARFRLDPMVDIDKLNLPPMTRMLAKAAQTYGMIVRDQTGHAISFFAENPGQSGTNPYTGPGGFYGGSDANAVIRSFPWQYSQLVKMSLRTLR
jgi:hypothetical protein